MALGNDPKIFRTLEETKSKIKQEYIPDEAGSFNITNPDTDSEMAVTEVEAGRGAGYKQREKNLAETLGIGKTYDIYGENWKVLDWRESENFNSKNPIYEIRAKNPKTNKTLTFEISSKDPLKIRNIKTTDSISEINADKVLKRSFSRAQKSIRKQLEERKEKELANRESKRDTTTMTIPATPENTTGTEVKKTRKPITIEKKAANPKNFTLNVEGKNFIWNFVSENKKTGTITYAIDGLEVTYKNDPAVYEKLMTEEILRRNTPVSENKKNPNKKTDSKDADKEKILKDWIHYSQTKKASPFLMQKIAENIQKNGLENVSQEQKEFYQKHKLEIDSLENKKSNENKLNPTKNQEKNSRIEQKIKEALKNGQIEKIKMILERDGLVLVTHGNEYTNRDTKEKNLIPQTDFDGKLTGYIVSQLTEPKLKIVEQRFVPKKGEMEEAVKGDVYFDTEEKGEIISVRKDSTGKEYLVFGNHYAGRGEKTSSAEIAYLLLKELKMLPENVAVSEKMREFIAFNNNTDNLTLPKEIKSNYREMLPKTLYGLYEYLPFEIVKDHFLSGKTGEDPLDASILSQEIDYRGKKITIEELQKEISKKVFGSETGIKKAKKEMAEMGTPETHPFFKKLLLNTDATSPIAMKEVVFSRGYNSMVTIKEKGAFISFPGVNIEEYAKELQKKYPEIIPVNSMILYFPEKTTFNATEFLETLGIKGYVKKEKIPGQVEGEDLDITSAYEGGSGNAEAQWGMEEQKEIEQKKEAVVAKETEAQKKEQEIKVVTEIKKDITQELQKATPEQLQILDRKLAEAGLNIAKLDREVEGFSGLSIGQKLLIAEQMKNSLVNNVRAEAYEKMENRLKKENGFKRFFTNIRKKYLTAKYEQEALRELKYSPYEAMGRKHNEVLERIRQVKELGINVVAEKNGAVRVEFARIPENIPQEEKQVYARYNQAISNLASTPEEWGFDRSRKDLQEKFRIAERNYEDAKNNLLAIKLRETKNMVEAGTYINTLDAQMLMLRHDLAHPDLSKEIKEIETRDPLFRVWTSKFTERSGQVGLGVLGGSKFAKYFAILGSGLAGAIVIAAGSGAIMGNWRARMGLRERDRLARKGIEDASTTKDKTILNGTDAKRKLESLMGKIDTLLKEEKPTEATKYLRMLGNRAQFTEQKMRAGKINDGHTRERTGNRLALIQTLNKARNYINVYIDNRGVESFEEQLIIDNEEKRVAKRTQDINTIAEKNLQKKRGNYLVRETLKGAVLGGVFATAGYYVGQLFDGNTEVPQRTPVAGPVENPEPVIPVEKPKVIIREEIVQKPGRINHPPLKVPETIEAVIPQKTEVIEIPTVVEEEIILPPIIDKTPIAPPTGSVAGQAPVEGVRAPAYSPILPRGAGAGTTPTPDLPRIYPSGISSEQYQLQQGIEIVKGILGIFKKRG